MMTFLACTATLLGTIFTPSMTLGCVLIHFDHPVIGGISIVVGIIRGIAD